MFNAPQVTFGKNVEGGGRVQHHSFSPTSDVRSGFKFSEELAGVGRNHSSQLVCVSLSSPLLSFLFRF